MICRGRACWSYANVDLAANLLCKLVELVEVPIRRHKPHASSYRIFVLYAAAIFFVFSIWLFHGFKTNQLVCCKFVYPFVCFIWDRLVQQEGLY